MKTELVVAFLFATTINLAEGADDCKTLLSNDYGTKAISDIANSVKKIQQCLKQDIEDLKKQPHPSRGGLCYEYLVLNSKVQDVKITESSECTHANWVCDGSRSYLNTPYERTTRMWKIAGWKAKSNDKNQYLQVKFSQNKNVTGIAIQGRGDGNQWVTKVRILYSTDCKTWKAVKTVRNDEEFTANSDGNTIRNIYFPSTVIAKCVRFNPTKWKNHISMRGDVIGCSV